MIREDSVWTKKELNPNLFSKNKIKPDIRKKLLKIAKDFYDELEMDFKLQDVLLVGSNVSYNYTEVSDLDVHILADFNAINVPTDILIELFKAKKSLWNTAHDITINGHEVELYVQDTREKNISNGIYSLGKNGWIQEPKYTEPKTDQKLVIQKTDKYIKYISCLERSAKLSDGASSMHQQALKFKEDLFTKRKAGLAKIGIFSIENLVFKVLRTKGHIERLDNIINKSYDSQFTAKE